MKFAREMLEAKKALEEMGFQVDVAEDTEQCVDNPGLNMDIDHCVENDVMRSCFKQIEDSDAILVLNHEKNGIPGYVGGNTLMDIGLATYLNKKIFILNPLPSEDQIRYVHEIKLVRPFVLDGDISRIKHF